MPKVTQSAPIFTKNSILQITTQEQSDVTHFNYMAESEAVKNPYQHVSFNSKKSRLTVVRY